YFLTTLPAALGPTLFPYTTLFRSGRREGEGPRAAGHPRRARIQRGLLLHAQGRGYRGARPIHRPRAEISGVRSARQALFLRGPRSEEHTSELQSLRHLVCRLLLEK